MTRAARLACSLALLALAGCARDAARPVPPPASVASPPGEGVPRDEPRAKYGNPPFYEVGGRRYVVLTSAVGYTEQGIASWYGPDFHGGRTATGETYDMDAMTGAHPTLPLPTWVRVTNLENGRSVVVRLNDRGPFARGRIIDLSRAAAERLDMIRSGTARVEVVSLAGAARVAGAPAAAATYYAQAGAFGSRENAEALASRLRDAGIAGVAVAESISGGRPIYRVRAGPVATLPEFDALIERLRVAGAADARLAL
ncbi:MAG: septal ring lytic transglycosylase RlpA family protein [Gammaproteobacteria bacterium]|nr:septal ring lytic transglycosylase RlpA family protein [Gammaproteobacteria bacterium]